MHGQVIRHSKTRSTFRAKAEWFEVETAGDLPTLEALLANHRIIHSVNSYRGPYTDRKGSPVFYIVRSSDPLRPNAEDFCSLAVRLVGKFLLRDVTLCIRKAMPELSGAS